MKGFDTSCLPTRIAAFKILGSGVMRLCTFMVMTILVEETFDYILC
jgi:hypothetical protein